jgi:hypothetical protein
LEKLRNNRTSDKTREEQEQEYLVIRKVWLGFVLQQECDSFRLSITTSKIERCCTILTEERVRKNL